MRPGNRRKAGTVTGDPPVRRRLVGGALRRYRENVGYALEDAARVLECDRSKISRIETGQRGIRPKELRELLAEYGVPASEQLALVSIAGRGGQHSWWHPYADTLSDAYLDYVIMESAASEIMTYEAQLIPDLLQTDDYARAIVAAEPGYVTGQQREDAMAAKAARRQAVLSGSRRLSVVLGEGALRQVVGGTDVLAAQISYLARLSDEAPAVTLQVLPFSAGAHAGAGSGSLAILRFPDAPSLGVVYLEALSGGVYLESQDDVARYIRAFALLRAAALSPRDSARLLRGLTA
jgi:transcriptional regulator with XRE-family HTH domain